MSEPVSCGTNDVTGALVVVGVVATAVARVTGPVRAAAFALIVDGDGAGHSMQAAPVRHMFAASRLHLSLSAAISCSC